MGDEAVGPQCHSDHERVPTVLATRATQGRNPSIGHASERRPGCRWPVPTTGESSDGYLGHGHASSCMVWLGKNGNPELPQPLCHQDEARGAEGAQQRQPVTAQMSRSSQPGTPSQPPGATCNKGPYPGSQLRSGFVTGYKLGTDQKASCHPDVGEQSQRTKPTHSHVLRYTPRSSEVSFPTRCADSTQPHRYPSKGYSEHAVKLIL